MERLDGGNRYSQLANKEQHIYSEELQLGNSDQLCGNEKVSFRNQDSATHNGTSRYRFLIGCSTALTLVFSILQLLSLLAVNGHMRIREEAQDKPLGGYESDIPSSEPEWPCGITVEEARKAGCYFDLGLVAWLPHACYNKELDESFRISNPWEFWLPNNDNTGPNITMPVTTESELQKQPVQMVDSGWPGHSWSTIEFHDAHCMHTWKYLHQALLKGKKVPTSITGWSHTTHCTHASLIDTSNITYQEISPTAHSRYPMCIEVGSLRGEMLDLY